MADESSEFATLIEAGRKLKQHSEQAEANFALDSWLQSVTEYLAKHFSKQVALEWQCLPDPPLVLGRQHKNDERMWSGFRNAVNERIAWLTQLDLRSTSRLAHSQPMIDIVNLDPDLRTRCVPLVNASPDDPKVWDSAARTAGVVLEDRLRTTGDVQDGSVGRDLVNKIFGKAGTLAKHFSQEAEREGYRDLFAGIAGAFRNPSAHKLIDPNPEEASAYIIFVNLLLKHLASFEGPGPTTRETFLAACSPEAAAFFAGVLRGATKHKHQVSFGVKGFSVRTGGQPAFFFCYPPGVTGWAESRIEVYLADIRDSTLQSTMRKRFLELDGVQPGGRYTIRLPVASATIPNARAVFRLAQQFMEEQRYSAMAAEELRTPTALDS